MSFIKCVLYLAMVGIASFILGRLMPPSWFHEESFPYKSFDWEKSGTVYQAIGIRKWQKRVPDMSRFFPQIMQEKKLGHNFQENLPIMVKETCIAEFIHTLLCFAGLACISIWPGMGGFCVAVLYTLGNIPFILIQRYNRPRLAALQQRISCRYC